jgi:carboxylesterase
MIGCVILHGFTGSPYEVEPLADHLEQFGWKVSVPTLPGHGPNRDEMKKVTWKDWVQAAEKEVSKMIQECSVVYLIGFSMGGLIAAHLATKYPITKLVLLSACVYYVNPQQIFHNMAEAIKSNFSSGGKELLKKYMERSLSTPIRAVIHFRRLVKVLKPDLSKISVPTLILQGECDDIVEPRSATYIYEQIKSPVKELYFLPRSKHVICRDCEGEEVIQLVDQFLHMK